jgi:hypothetical protein
MLNETDFKYSVEEIKSEYKTFKNAKKVFNIKAQSWISLVNKLNSPTYERLKETVDNLLKENEYLRKENEKLNLSISKTKDFDEIGFWLLDNNFDRSRFSDFNIPEKAFKIESVAKVFYKDLAQKYHPDKGGTEMQMTNLNRLFEQIMTLVEMNNGLGN